MADAHELNVTLPDDLAQMVRDKIAAGDYACESDVVSEGLRALQDRDEEVERWLREEVVPTFEAYMADPSRGIPAEQVFDELQQRFRARSADKG